MRIASYNYQDFQEVITPSASKTVFIHKVRVCEHDLNVMSVIDASSEHQQPYRSAMGAIMFSMVAPEVRAFLKALFCASPRLSIHGAAHAMLAYKAACVDYAKYVRLDPQKRDNLSKVERYLHLPHKIDDPLINCVRKTPRGSLLQGCAEPNHPFDHISEQGGEGYLNKLRYFISKHHELHESDLSLINTVFIERFPRKNAFFEALGLVSDGGCEHHFVLSWFEDGDTSLRPIRLGVDQMQLSVLRHLWLMSQRPIIVDCMSDLAESIDQGAEPYRLEALLEYYRAVICEGLVYPIDALIEQDMMLDERIQIARSLFEPDEWLTSSHIQSGLHRHIDRELRKHSRQGKRGGVTSPVSPKTIFVTNGRPREDQMH